MMYSKELEELEARLKVRQDDWQISGVRVGLLQSLIDTASKAEERRLMLEKHEWQEYDRAYFADQVIVGHECLECGNHEGEQEHSSGCKLAALIKKDRI